MKNKMVKNGVLFLRAFKAPLDVTWASKKMIKRYKDKYKGQRCFIIGNGPSLTPTDLELLKNEITFAANRIYYMFDKTEWRPTFYCVQDINVLAEMNKEFMTVAEKAESTFIRLRCHEKISAWCKDIPNLIFVPIWNKLNGENGAQFSKNADRYLYDGSTVTYMSMQLAAYMGFSEIYLVGVDHSFPFQKDKDGTVKVVDRNIAAHFYETAENNIGEGAEKRRTNLHEVVTEAYASAERYSRKNNDFRIYNATRGGKLEVFERVNLDDLFK